MICSGMCSFGLAKKESHSTSNGLHRPGLHAARSTQNEGTAAAAAPAKRANERSRRAEVKKFPAFSTDCCLSSVLKQAKKKQIFGLDF